MFDDLHGFVTLLSLGLTWPALAICGLVLISWHEQYRAYCKATDRTASMFLIAGVYIAFAGSMVDNLWWGLAWTADYVARDHPWRDFLFFNGVYSNVIFRQSALIWAGLLHINAENMSRETEVQTVMVKRTTRKILWVSVGVGLLYIIALTGLKPLQ